MSDKSCSFYACTNPTCEHAPLGLIANCITAVLSFIEQAKHKRECNIFVQSQLAFRLLSVKRSRVIKWRDHDIFWRLLFVLLHCKRQRSYVFKKDILRYSMVDYRYTNCFRV